MRGGRAGGSGDRLAGAAAFCENLPRRPLYLARDRALRYRGDGGGGSAVPVSVRDYCFWWRRAGAARPRPRRLCAGLSRQWGCGGGGGGCGGPRWGEGRGETVTTRAEPPPPAPLPASSSSSSSCLRNFSKITPVGARGGAARAAARRRFHPPTPAWGSFPTGNKTRRVTAALKRQGPRSGRRRLKKPRRVGFKMGGRGDDLGSLSVARCERRGGFTLQKLGQKFLPVSPSGWSGKAAGRMNCHLRPP